MSNSASNGSAPCRNNQAQDDPAVACPDSLTIAAYLDAKLGPDETALFERHLAGCLKCRMAVSELRELLEGLGANAAGQDAPEEVASKAKGLFNP